MKIRTFVALTTIGLLVLFGAFSGACKNGGGALTLEEYFQQLDALDNDFTTRSDANDSQIQQTEDVDEARGFLGDQLEAFQGFLDGLRDLDAPDEVSDAHDAAREAGQTFRDEFDASIDQMQDAQSLDELFSGFDSPSLTAAAQAFTDACLELERIAADNDITVDLGCEDDSDEPTAEPTTASTAEPSSELESYFADLDEAENAYHETTDPIDEQFSALDDSTVDQAAGLFEDAIVAIDAFVADLEALDPPAEVAAAHDETVAGLQAASALIEEHLPAMEAATTAAEVTAFFSSEELVSITTSLDGACTALTSIADGNGVIIDLSCEG